MTYQSRKRPASLIPMDCGSVPRWSALRTMTGKALEYFRAFARCCLHEFVKSVFVLTAKKRGSCAPAPACACVLIGIVSDPQEFYQTLPQPYHAGNADDQRHHIGTTTVSIRFARGGNARGQEHASRHEQIAQNFRVRGQDVGQKYVSLFSSESWIPFQR